MLDFIKRIDRRQRFLLYASFYGFFCNGMLSLLMGSVMPDLKAAYGLTDTVSGVFLSAHSAGNLIAGFISGLVPLWLGRRRSIMLLSSLGMLGYVMMLVFGNPVWLFVAFLFVGMGRGSVTNFSNRMVNRLSGGSPAATNLLHSAFAIGAILTPAVFLTLRTSVSWQAGVVFVAVCILFSVTNYSRMKMEDDHPARSDKQNSTLCFLKDPSFLTLAMMMFCYLCSEYAINGWLVTYVQHKDSLMAALTASSSSLTAYSQMMATLLWVVMLIGRLICAALSMRVSQRLMMFVSSIGMAAFFLLMLLSENTIMLTLSVVGLGLCMAGICPMIYSDAAHYTNTYPMATSALLAIGSAGAIVMPTVVGSLAERLGFGGGMSAILVTIVLLVVFSGVNQARKRDYEKDTGGAKSC